MKCRNCGAEIADKALICYRCGTATTEAKYQATPLRPRRRGPQIVAIVLVVALLVLVAMYFLRRLG
jgi:hypothetical protein